MVGGYLGDVVVHGTNWNEHMSALAAVLKRLQGAGVRSNPSKWKL